MGGSRRATAVIGAGRLATALLPAMARAGYPIRAVAARRIARARRACRAIPGARPTVRLAEAVDGTTLVLLAVPDRAIADVAERLAVKAPRGWGRRVVLHHAGALGPEPLRALSARGAAAGVLHPFQCLGEVPGSEVLPGSRARIEGDPAAARVARRLARDLGMVPVNLPPPVTASDRAAYHAAASLASNDLVALLHAGVRLLESAGFSRKDAFAALLALSRGTLRQVETAGIEGALTGPVARGDAETLGRQLRRIAGTSRAAAAAHRELSRVLLELAGGTGRLSPKRRAELRRLLRRG